MDLSNYLAKLVENRKEVGISGLGTFYKKKSPGRYDTQLHSFVPPTFTLQFKTEVSEQSELAEYIHLDRNVSVASANYFIVQYVEDIQEKLKVYNEAEIGTLGKLVSTAGILSFIPARLLNSEINFFGLPKLNEENLAIKEDIITEIPISTLPVHTPSAESIPEPLIPPIYRETEVLNSVVTQKEELNEIESITNDNLATEENPGEIEKDPELIELTQVDPERNLGEIDPLFIINELVLEEEKNNIQRMGEEVLPEPEAKTPLYLIVLLGFLGILVAFFIIYFMFPKLSSDFNNNYDDSTKKSGKEMRKPVQIIKPADTSRTDTVSKQDSSLKVQSSAPVVQTADSIFTTFEVIGSSPKKQKEASQFIKEMRIKYGIQAKIVSQVPGKKMKISIGTFKTKREADDYLPILSKKLGIDGLYTYLNTHKPE